MLQVGDQMPQFTLRTRDREEFTDEDLRGGIAIVAFYPMAFTGGWTREMEGFRGVYDALKDLGAHVVGVSADTWAAQGVFQDDLDLQFPLLSDWWENKTIEAFGVGVEGRPTSMRATFIFDAEGVVQAVIDDPREMEAHPEGALAAVRRLVTGSST